MFVYIPQERRDPNDQFATKWHWLSSKYEFNQRRPVEVGERLFMEAAKTKFYGIF